MAPDAMSYPRPQASGGIVYPVSDQMGETGFQQFVILGLLLPLQDYFAVHGRDVLASFDQFFYYHQGDPRACVAPDVYLIDDETLAPRDIDCWKVWEHNGKVPHLALEIVSRKTHRKDYTPRMLERYTDLGVHELIRYDPDHHGRTDRQRLTHWVRDAAGTLVQRPTLADRVQSDHFGFWLLVQPDQSQRMSPDGATPWPTQAERITAEARAETARRAAEAREQAERAAAEIQRLRAELARRGA